MRLQQFQVSVVEQTQKKLPRGLRAFQARSFFTLVKLSYTRPKIHYEVAVRGKERLIEIGLHCEAEPATNAALLAYFEARAFEIHAELGPRIEIEQWTNSWSRVHQVVAYTMLDAELVQHVARELAQMIIVLEPLVNAFFARTRATKQTAKRKPSRGEK
ncbi:MAG: hypothetical protein HY868_17625 [Chloroflexi bacterium]|nr:hypothetical protein [Chloroflexota bacterium]